MTSGAGQTIRDVFAKQEKELLTDWVQNQLSATSYRSDLLRESELREQSREFIALLQRALPEANLDRLDGEVWTPVRDFLTSLSRSRAIQGFSPSETAIFVFSLKQALFVKLRAKISAAQALAD